MSSLLSKLINSKSSWHYFFTHPPVIVLFSFFPHPVYIFLSHLFSPFLGFFWRTSPTECRWLTLSAVTILKSKILLNIPALVWGMLIWWDLKRSWQSGCLGGTERTQQKSSALCPLSRGREDFIDSPFSPPKSSSIYQNALCFFFVWSFNNLHVCCISTEVVFILKDKELFSLGVTKAPRIFSCPTISLGLR